MDILSRQGMGGIANNHLFGWLVTISLPPHNCHPSTWSESHFSYWITRRLQCLEQGITIPQIFICIDIGRNYWWGGSKARRRMTESGSRVSTRVTNVIGYLPGPVRLYSRLHPLDPFFLSLLWIWYSRSSATAAGEIQFTQKDGEERGDLWIG